MTKPAVLLAFFLASAALMAAAPGEYSGSLSDTEVRILQSLALSKDMQPPASPSNRVADEPAARRLGKKLFFDSRLSANKQLSCASCHSPALYFTDGKARSQGLGPAMRNAPTVVGAAMNSWFYWDGRRDSLWSQALLPFEAQDELGLTRIAVLQVIANDRALRDDYEALFGELPPALADPDMPASAGPYGSSVERTAWQKIANSTRNEISGAFANLGKAIAAYERTLMPEPTRFDRFVWNLEESESTSSGALLTSEELAGAKLFIDIDETRCIRCHNGPMMTNGGFHNIGTGKFSGSNMDFGRVFGMRAVLMDEFNCVGPFSDAAPEECLELRFLNKDAHVPLEGAFKVPSLRGLSKTEPYFHDGRFDSLRAVLDHYVNPPAAAGRAHELQPLTLTETEISSLLAFLRAL